MLTGGTGLRAPLTPGPFLPKLQPKSAAPHSWGAGRSAGPSAGDAGAEGWRLLPPATARLFFFLLFFPFPSLFFPIIAYFRVLYL